MAVVVFAGIALAQGGVSKRTFVVNGKRGEVLIYEIDGQAFVDLEDLARIGSGSLKFQGHQIVLSLPVSPGNTPAPASTNSQPTDTGLSDAFMRAAIEDLGIIENWQNIVAYGVRLGIPGNGNPLVSVRDKAAEGLRLAIVASSTDSDRSALQLLTNHFNNVQQWVNTLVESRKNMDAAAYLPSALNNDPLYQKILNCSTSLGTMLPSGTFTDDGSCS